jgi:Na+-translocating ferredoxin:NAD+ oxidoreductase subunit B
MKPESLTQGLLDRLPQTQCQRCGFEDCEAYAKSIAHENTPINQCPPGGQEGIRRLAELTHQEAPLLNPTFGLEGPRKMAFIDEQWCIGCTLCLDACPTDAIIGTHKSMHTVIESFCTGCELCVPVCPIDCIELETATPERTGWHAWSSEQAQEARLRYADHKKRLDEKALKGPKTHTQAKRLHALETASTRQKTDPGHSSFGSEAQEFKDCSESGEPIQSPSELQPPVLDKAALVQKALQKAIQKAQAMTRRPTPPDEPQK